MLERRKHDRSRDFTSGAISFDRSPVPLPCVIRNLSEGGALLLLDEPHRAPTDLDLAVRGGTRPARVVWRSETEVGVAFAATMPTAAPRPRPGSVVCLDAARRARAGGSDERRLSDRIARFVRPPCRPDPA